MWLWKTKWKMEYNKIKENICTYNKNRKIYHRASCIFISIFCIGGRRYFQFSNGYVSIHNKSDHAHRKNTLYTLSPSIYICIYICRYIYVSEQSIDEYGKITQQEKKGKRKKKNHKKIRIKENIMKKNEKKNNFQQNTQFFLFFQYTIFRHKHSHTHNIQTVAELAG